MSDMSQVPRRRPPIRRVRTGYERLYEQAPYEEEFEPEETAYEEEEEDYKPRRAARGGQDYRTRDSQPRRDPFPLILGALIGAVVVGVFVIVFLMSSKNNQAPAGSAP